MFLNESTDNHHNIQLMVMIPGLWLLDYVSFCSDAFLACMRQCL